MNTPNYNAYQQAQKLAITPSAAESASLSRAAVLLEQAKSNVKDFKAYSTALNFNQKFWTILQADLTSDGNRLPVELRGDLLSLSVFINKQTVKALSDPNPEHLDVLIDINRNVAQGLRDQSNREQASS